MASIFGRQVVVPLTNKSGGGVVAGDVVVIDTTNNAAFTTTTSAGSTISIGVVQETIGSNASGRVLTAGYAALVNVNASVTRGNYGKTHTVAKQATDAGSARVSGTFCQFLTGGTTPSAMVYPVDLAGAALTDPTSNRGEIIRRGAAALEALQAKTAGKVLIGDGTDVISDYPPGHEWQYDQVTGDATITGTTEGTATTVIDATAFTADGAPVITSFYSPQMFADTSATTLQVVLLEGSTVIAGRLCNVRTGTVSGSDWRQPLYGEIRWTPASGSRTLHIKALKTSGTWQLSGGAGGTGTLSPMYVRTVKV